MIRESRNDTAIHANQFDLPFAFQPEFDSLSHDSWLAMLGAIGEGSAPSSSLPTSRDSSAPPTPFNADPSIFPSLSTSYTDGNETTFSDMVIDPSLLLISDYQRKLASNATIDLAPALVQSPLPSPNSLADLATPNWDSQFPDPGIYSDDQGVYFQMSRDQYWFNFASQGIEDNTVANVTSSQNQFVSKPWIAMNPEPVAVQPPGTIHLPTSDTTLTSAESLTAVRTQKRPSVGLGRNATKGMAREEILGKARERKRQLVAELERAKVELWETTIEQGVLSQLVKDCA